jgi:hypothetical protein
MALGPLIQKFDPPFFLPTFLFFTEIVGKKKEQFLAIAQDLLWLQQNAFTAIN